MSSRLIGALIAILVLGGGSIAFIVLRAQSERADRVADVLRAVDAELASSHDPESLRLVLRQIRNVRAEDPDTALRIAEARVLLELGRTQEAWDSVRPLATAPGAADDALRVGALVLTRLHAESGDVATARQALAMADEHARRTGSSASRFLAWQLAYRAGDIGAFAALSTEIVDSEEQPFADAVRAAVGPMAGALADRIGLDRDELKSTAEGDAGSLATAMALAEEPPARAAEIDDLDARFEGGVPELEVVAATRVLEEYGAMSPEEARGARAESLLRDALRRINVVLDRYPASVEARHVAVVALIGLRQSFDLDDEQLVRYRGHLEWLVRNAPETHVQRPLWRRLLSDLGR